MKIFPYFQGSLIDVTSSIFEDVTSLFVFIILYLNKDHVTTHSILHTEIL